LGATANSRWHAESKCNFNIGNIAVDISVYDDGGIRTSRLVSGYLKEYPVARDLVLLVKAYMRRHKVNEVFLGGLGSYATFCLVISFLQVCSAMVGK
jgi:non-canonical poly(A) RNA polymerase PAPD5/7